MNKCIRVLIVDDHTLFRHGLKKLLEAYKEIEIVGEATDGEDAIGKIEEAAPDIVLMDIKMPRMDGIESMKDIKKSYPGLNVIVLSMYEDAEYVLKAINAGASGYMQKDVSADRLVGTIRQVHRGNKPLVHLTVDCETLRGLISEIIGTSKDRGLSDLEKRILKLMAGGNSNKQIAKELYMAEQTVKGHIHSIFQKLNAFDRTKAVAEAVREGLVE